MRKNSKIKQRTKCLNHNVHNGHNEIKSEIVFYVLRFAVPVVFVVVNFHF